MFKALIGTALLLASLTLGVSCAQQDTNVDSAAESHLSEYTFNVSGMT